MRLNLQESRIIKPDTGVKEVHIDLPYKFIPREYQEGLLYSIDAGYKRAFCVWHRRAGKDKTAINLMITQACQVVGVYYYFFPTYNQGKKIIWDGMDKDGFKFLDHFPPQMIASKNSQEMKIVMANGSIFQIIGSENFDNVMGSNPRGCIFSEYSLQNPKAFDFIRPILVQNEGWAVFILCVAQDTLVITENGLERIGNTKYPQGFTKINKDVFGLNNSFHKATDYYNGGEQETLTITTSRGYELTGTPKHPIWTGEKWIKLRDLNIGDTVPIQRNQQVWGNNTTIDGWDKPPLRQGSIRPRYIFKITERIMYILGLILAEGCWNKSSVFITTKYDQRIHDTITRFGFVKYDEFHYGFCSNELASFIEWFGMKKGAKNKNIPDRLLSMPKKLIANFLRGYFDGDGSSNKRDGSIHCDSVSEQLIKDLQVLLLNFGIISTRRKYTTKPTKKVKVSSVVWRLEVYNYSAYLFYKQIGFKLYRKQKNIGKLTEVAKEWYPDCVQINKELIIKYIKNMNVGYIKRNNFIRYRTLKRLLKRKKDNKIQKIVDDNFLYDKIVSIEKGRAHVYDYVIPDTHSFFCNGFIGHNTPRGMNHAWELYNSARKNQDIWYTEVLTINDTKAVSEEAIQEERDSGMPEDVVQQEFFCSWAASQAHQFIRFDSTTKAKNRTLDERTYRHMPIIIGVDVARFGGDRSVISVRQGLKIHELKSYPNFDTIEFAREVIQTKREWEADYIFVDVVGLGAGVVDYIRDVGYSVIEVNAGEKAEDSFKYFNKRVEMWDRMRQWLKNADIPNDPELIADLTNPEYKIVKDQQLKLETKEEMSKRGVPSPDKGDAIAHTFYEEVAMDFNDDYDDIEYEAFKKSKNRQQMVDETGY